MALHPLPSVVSYILNEKLEIARRYLEPTARQSMGLQEEHMKIEDSAMTSLIQGYCREAGVRNLQKHVEKICRKVALKVVRPTGWGGASRPRPR